MESTMARPLNTPHHREHHHFDVCVVGGGMAGMCAAIAAARRGAKTAIVQDRPVFGGNASSEIRMWICGAKGEHNKETGILEEIQLANYHRNPSLNYSIWDSVLYEAIAFQPNLTAFMNCTCVEGEMEGRRLHAIHSWQLTTQTWHTIEAKQFIDCSGDSVLAPITGADVRAGREARHEYNEDIQPEVADAKTMGNSLLIQLRRTDESQPFTAPRWAYKFESPRDLPSRINGVEGTNFWWIEVGGLQDTIRDAERIQQDLMKVVYGVWDYIKNRAPEREKAENWAVEWIGSLPGKRENRRYLGPHVLTQNCIRDGGVFDDIIAYGGWSMDDHHPAGIYYPGKPTIFHPAPSPYGIPYRTLFSRNVANLFCAGRNISTTHAALSSTRVMATCALLGQAAGTAAALCVREGKDPADLYPSRVSELQRQLMEDDCFLPGRVRPISEATEQAQLQASGQGAPHLRDGIDRDQPNQNHAWESPLGGTATYQWHTPTPVGDVRLVFDSNLRNNKRQPCSYPQKGDRCLVPDSLVRSFRLEAQQSNGSWQVVHRETENIQRLVRVPLNLQARALRLVPESLWGKGEVARVFAFDVLSSEALNLPINLDGPAFSQVIAQVDPANLAAPDSGLEDENAKRSVGA